MPIYKNVLDDDGVLDWVFDEKLNRLQYLSDTNSPTLEVEITHRLTTLFFNNIQVTESGITGDYSIPDEVFGEKTPINVPSVVKDMQISDTSRLQTLNDVCKQALESLKTQFGLTNIEVVSYIDQQTKTIICEVLLLFNETGQQRYTIELWKFN